MECYLLDNSSLLGTVIVTTTDGILTGVVVPVPAVGGHPFLCRGQCNTGGIRPLGWLSIFPWLVFPQRGLVQPLPLLTLLVPFQSNIKTRILYQTRQKCRFICRFIGRDDSWIKLGTVSDSAGEARRRTDYRITTWIFRKNKENTSTWDRGTSGIGQEGVGIVGAEAVSWEQSCQLPYFNDLLVFSVFFTVILECRREKKLEKNQTETKKMESKRKPNCPRTRKISAVGSSLFLGALLMVLPAAEILRVRRIEQKGYHNLQNLVRV